VQIVTVSGSAGSLSVSRTALRAAAGRLAELGAEVTWVDLGEMRLPVFHPDEEAPPAINQVRRLAREADGFLVGTPDYHGAPGGALINLLNYLDEPEFADKPVALVAASGGARGGVGPLSMLRLIFRTLHAVAIPEQVALTAKDLTPDGNVAPGLGARLRGLAESLYEWADLLKQKRDRKLRTAR
jgi:azobenzene reductase